MDVLTEAVLLILIGFFIGFLCFTVGIGGGPFLIPLFLIYFALGLNFARGTSVFSIFISSIGGLIIHIRHHHIDWKKVIFFSVSSILGSITCILILNVVQVNTAIFSIIFAIFLLILATNLIKSLIQQIRIPKTKSIQNDQTSIQSENKLVQNPTDYPGFKHEFRVKNAIAISIPIFFFSGFISFFLGIGGAVINTPILYGVFNYPILLATAQSISILTITTGFYSIVFGIRGQINFFIGILIAIGMSMGSIFASHNAYRISQNKILFVLICILIYTITVSILFALGSI